jgi:hypothetical protein
MQGNGTRKADIIIGFFNVAKPLNSSNCIIGYYIYIYIIYYNYRINY